MADSNNLEQTAASTFMIKVSGMSCNQVAQTVGTVGVTYISTVHQEWSAGNFWR